jgi:hypothetical protein
VVCKVVQVARVQQRCSRVGEGGRRQTRSHELTHACKRACSDNNANRGVHRDALDMNAGASSEGGAPAEDDAGRAGTPDQNNLTRVAVGEVGAEEAPSATQDSKKVDSTPIMPKGAILKDHASYRRTDEAICK